MMKINLRHSYQILIWEGRLMVIYIFVGLAQKGKLPCQAVSKFGYRVKRDVKLSPVKYFNQRLLHTVKSLLQSKIIFYLLEIFCRI